MSDLCAGLLLSAGLGVEVWFELSRKLRSEGYINVTVNALHSGPVQTKLLRLIPFHGLLYKILGGLFPTTHKVRYLLHKDFL